MNASRATCSAVVASLLLVACGGDAHDHAHPHPETAKAAPTAHDHEHDPAQRKDLGEVTVGARTFRVVAVAAIEPGKESDFDLDFGKSPRPETVRCWVGLESAVGSRKVRFANEGETVMHGHPEVPSPLPANSRFWIAIEENGVTASGSVAIDR